MTLKQISDFRVSMNTSRTPILTFAITGLACGLVSCTSEAPGPKVETEQPVILDTVTPAPKYLTRLECGGVGSAPGFERSYVLYAEGNALTFIKGYPGELGYESWSGTISDTGSVTLEGTYEDTPGQPRDISFSGSLTETSLNLSGTRGPRECTAIGKLPNA